MSFSVGIIGLPNVGKSTLFKALTRKKVNIASYPFTTIEPNVGVVAVPDERLKKIAEIIKPGKVTPTVIEFIDIAGLVKDAHKGQGLGNQFLAQIRNCDAILEVVRAFEDAKVEHVSEEFNPQTDAEIIKTELLMKDLETLEKSLPKLEKEAKGDRRVARKIEVLKRIRESLYQEKLVSEINFTEEEKEEIKEYQFLTAKPTLHVLNTDGKDKSLSFTFEHLLLNLKEEEEVSELSDSEAEELEVEFHLEQLILGCYKMLDLITFYTVAGGKESRAWTIKKGSGVLKAASSVHSDFERNFIKAEIINWRKLVEAESWAKARELGWAKIVGKEYVVEDCDVIEFKI